MKRLLVLILTLVLVCSFAGCKEGQSTDSNGTENASQAAGEQEVTQPLYTSLDLSDYPFADVDWNYANGVLTIKGNGKMPNGMSDEHPWNIHADKTTKIVVEEGIIGIGQSNFYGFYSLESVSLPSTLLYIGETAFADCFDLTSVAIPESVKEIHSAAFQSCEALETVKLPSALTEIGDEAFAYCDSLTTIDIPSGVKVIGERAFTNSGLTEFTFPESVVEMGYGVLSSCYDLESVKLYASAPDIPNFLYGGAKNVQLEVGDNYVIENGVLYNKDKTVLIAGVDSSLKDANAPASVAKIADYAFESHESVTNVNIGENTRIIGEHAFSSCDSLKNVTIGESLETLGKFAFSWSKSIENLNFPESTKTVEYGVFRGCESLTSVSFAAAKENMDYDDGDDERLPENLIMTFGD